MNLKIGVIGANSMVGARAVSQLRQSENVEVIEGNLSGANPIDITDRASTGNFFSKNDFQWTILFSAFTDVNGAQSQKGDRNGSCWKINVDGVKNVVEACKKHTRKLIFISTDFIFDGTSGPYTEEDPPGPDLDKVGWYGITKMEGEKCIGQNFDSQNFLIIRIAFPFSGKNTGKEDFAVKTVNLYRNGNLYPMYDDQIITPTFIPDVAPAVLALLANSKTGTFHLASPALTTPHEFATYLISKFEGKQIELPKGRLAEQLRRPQATPRPLKGGLIVEKITPFFKPTSWKEGADKAIDILRHEIDLSR